MKIRAGFVSNSSSSSFAILGLHFGQRELEDLAARWKENVGRLSGLVGRCLDKCGHDLGYVYNEGEAWIGAGFEDMGADETKTAFMQRVVVGLTALTGREVKPSEVCWFVDSYWS